MLVGVVPAADPPGEMARRPRRGGSRRFGARLRRVGRIIAGRHRGHRLAAPSSNATRPTTDRVRESVFGALTSWLGRGSAPVDRALDGIGFLDLFAGSGAIGLEAASRGAAPVRLVERDPKVAALAARNAASLGGAVAVARSAVAPFLAGPATGYDVVWLDPPYDLGGDALADVLGLVVDGGWLAPGGLVMVERSSRTSPPQFPATLADVWILL